MNGGATPERHGGVDIAAALGTPVQCPADGLVEYAGFLQLSGNTIVIEHGGGLKSYFYHMDSLDVATGDRVEKGRLLGAVGTTGYSTGPHLHYEVKIGREERLPLAPFRRQLGHLRGGRRLSAGAIHFSDFSIFFY